MGRSFSLNASVRLAAVATTTVGNHGHSVREQSHYAGALDCHRDIVLMLRASASNATGLNLAAISRKFAEKLRVLIVDKIDVFLAELAVLAMHGALLFAALPLPLLCH